MTKPIGDVDRQYCRWPNHGSHHRGGPKSEQQEYRDLQDQMEDLLLEMEAAEHRHKYESGWLKLRGIHRDYKLMRDSIAAKPDDDIHRGPRKYQKKRGSLCRSVKRAAGRSREDCAQSTRKSQDAPDATTASAGSDSPERNANTSGPERSGNSSR